MSAVTHFRMICRQQKIMPLSSKHSVFEQAAFFYGPVISRRTLNPGTGSGPQLFFHVEPFPPASGICRPVWSIV